MSRKRRVSEQEREDAENEEPETEEMDVDVDDDEPVTFMDTFYGLASNDPRDRTEAARDMMNHCLLGPEANTKDAAYALERLMKGVCSGRASARQGFASALTSFLKLSAKLGVLKQIKDGQNEEEVDETVVAFVHRKLSVVTNPSSKSAGRGKRKGSEERDFYFGRLFGILSVVRSGLLKPESASTDEADELTDVATRVASDLVKLCKYKKWMREPATHAIITLLESYYNTPKTESNATLVDAIVRRVIVPGMLAEDAFESNTRLTAEQLAVAIKIQSNPSFHGEEELPEPLDQQILSCSKLDDLIEPLCATSIVSQPRAHIIWDMVWQYLSEALERNPQKGLPPVRKLRETLPGGDSPSEIIDAIVAKVVVGTLLGGEAAGNHSTHERKALGLFIIRVLCGGVCVTTTGATFRLEVPHELLVRILEPAVVQKLFLDVMCAGTNNKTKHILKPLTASVLEEIVATIGDDFGRRLEVAKALLSCEPRFDTKTKTSTVVHLLLMADFESDEKELFTVWNDYIDFLEVEILRRGSTSNDNSKNLHHTLGFVDLSFNAAKFFLRTQMDKNLDFVLQGITRTLRFFSCCAFFDASGISPGKSSKKKDRQAPAVVRTGLRIKDAGSTLPYPLRVTMSARFFSVLADLAVASPARGDKVTSSTPHTKHDQEKRLLKVLCELHEDRRLLESHGAKTFSEFRNDNDQKDEGDDDDDDDEDAGSETETHDFSTIENQVCQLQKAAKDDEDSRLKLACANLASALILHVYSCGRPDTIENEVEMDDDEEETEAVRAEVFEIVADLAESLEEIEKVDADNKLTEFTQICVGVLRSSMGNNASRGGSTKLLRETVKSLWLGVLNFTVSAKEGGKAEMKLGSEVIHLLCSSVGADIGGEGESEADEDVDDEEEGAAASVFPQMISEDDEGDSDEMDVTTDKSSQHDDTEEASDNELTIDPANLQNLLLDDDSDEDDMDKVASELEHHEGADAALAKLIKLKQETRKAGQLARERNELADQQRASVLLETLLGNNFAPLLSCADVLIMVTPLLKRRRKLERSLEQTNKGGKEQTGTSETRTLLSKITSILTNKLFKLRQISTHEEGTTSEIINVASNVANLLRQKGSKEQSKCCSDALLMLCRMVSTPEALQTIYQEAVTEWSEKRTSSLEARVFDDLIQRMPSAGQALLAGPMCSAATNARSAFLKSEAFRILSSMVPSVPLKQSEEDGKDMVGQNAIKAAFPAFLLAVHEAATNEEMKKTKRVRDVLKTTAKWLQCATAAKWFDSSAGEKASSVQKAFSELSKSSESDSVVKSCDEVVSLLESYTDAVQAATAASVPRSKVAKKTKKKKKGKK